MTATPPAPLTTKELAALRREHVRYLLADRNGDPADICESCECDWPCIIARLIQTVERERVWRKTLAQELIAASSEAEQ